MATFTYTSAGNYLLPIWYGSITAHSAGSVTWSNGSNSTVFDGSYIYANNGSIAGGVINSIHETIGANPYLTVTGLSIPLNAYSNWTLSNETAFITKFFAGDDLINGSSHGDLLNGFAGQDTIFGNDGNDTIYGNDFDSISGGAGNDELHGSGCATLNGGAGDDTYYATTGGITFVEAPNEGTDTVFSNFTQTLGDNVENLTLTGSYNAAGMGSSTDNTITGNSGNNYLIGNGGNDTIIGGAGNDTVGGGAGNDTLTGGTGNDMFYFYAPTDATTNIDTITDFSQVNGNHDKISLAFSVFTIDGAGGHGLNPTEFWDQSKAAPGTDYHVLYNPSTGVLSYDIDGAGLLPGHKTSIAPVEIGIVGVSVHPVLTAADFYVAY